MNESNDYIIIDTRTGKGLEFCIAPMSGKPTFDFVTLERATMFNLSDSWACYQALQFIYGNEIINYLDVRKVI